MKFTPEFPRASVSLDAIQMIPGWQPSYGRRALPWPIPRRRPMAWLMPGVSAGASGSQARRSRTCRARPGVSSAGSRGGRHRQTTSSSSPLRPGRPPGYRRKPIHEVDEVLIECDGLACEAMKPDTS